MRGRGTLVVTTATVYATRLAPCAAPKLLADEAVLLALLVTVHDDL